MKESETSLKLVKASVREVVEESSTMDEEDIGRETRLYGSRSGIDSLDLVNIIVILEDKIQDKYGVSVTIANEDAMSRSKSPFLNVDSLAKYVDELVSK